MLIRFLPDAERFGFRKAGWHDLTGYSNVEIQGSRHKFVNFGF